jgi:hypothetical protein
LQHALEFDSDGEWQLENHESREESVDPAHDERVRNDHGHVVLHHTHHAIHSARIRHRVSRRLPAALGVFEVGTRLISCRESLTAGLERGRSQRVEVGPNSDAVDEGTLLL